MIITSRCFVFNTFQDDNISDIFNLECALKCSCNSYNPDLKEQGNIFFNKIIEKINKYIINQV